MSLEGEVGQGGIGKHEDRAIDLDLGIADAALRHDKPHALDGPEGIREDIEIPAGVLDDEVRRDGGVAIGKGLDAGHECTVRLMVGGPSWIRTTDLALIRGAL